MADDRREQRTNRQAFPDGMTMEEQLARSGVPLAALTPQSTDDLRAILRRASVIDPDDPADDEDEDEDEEEA